MEHPEEGRPRNTWQDEANQERDGIDGHKQATTAIIGRWPMFPANTQAKEEHNIIRIRDNIIQSLLNTI